MNELIKLSEQVINNEAINTVSARELHKFLEVTERFNSWMTRQLSYGFEQNVDYLGCKVFNTLAKQELDEYYLTLDAAKEICMLQKSEKGKQARKYFIECEKKLKEIISPKQKCFLEIIEASSQEQILLGLNKLNSEVIIPLENKVQEQAEVIQASTPKIDYHDLVLRCDTLLTVSQIAQDFGLSAQRLNKILAEEKVQYKNSEGVWMLYAKYLVNNFAQTSTHVYVDSNGLNQCKLHMKWTQKGRLFIYGLLKARGILPNCERE